MMETDLLLERVIDLALEVMNADRGFIMLVDDKNELETRGPADPRAREGEGEGQRTRHPADLAVLIAPDHWFQTAQPAKPKTMRCSRQAVPQSGSIQM